MGLLVVLSNVRLVLTPIRPFSAPGRNDTVPTFSVDYSVVLLCISENKLSLSEILVLVEQTWFTVSRFSLSIFLSLCAKPLQFAEVIFDDCKFARRANFFSSKLFILSLTAVKIDGSRICFFRRLTSEEYLGENVKTATSMKLPWWWNRNNWLILIFRYILSAWDWNYCYIIAETDTFCQRRTPFGDFWTRHSFEIVYDWQTIENLDSIQRNKTLT